MPKKVNHEEKRRSLAEATWRIICKEGLEAVSVRRVANEANMSLGALRYYFENQSELIRFSINMISEHIHERFAKIRFEEDPLKHIVTVVSQFMPIDEERRIEGEVWLSFISRAIHDHDIQELRKQVQEELYTSFSRMIGYLNDQGLLKEGIDTEVEVKRLHALVDGLSIHNLIHPAMMSPDEMVSIINYHLEQITIKPTKGRV